MKSGFVYDTVIGKLLIAEENGSITDVMSHDFDLISYEKRETDVIKQAKHELDEYFAGRLKQFAVPLSLSGTDFQKKVWDNLINVPYGETRTYKQLAESAGCPKGFRAVGGANHVNPVMIIVPCHRIIGANGKLTGYGGGLHMKEYLLELERKNKGVL